jgi:hypothetical protein
VGQQLREGHARDRRMQAGDVLSGRIVELQLALLAQFQHACGGEALRMRGDAKAMARRERLAGREIRRAEGPLENDLAAVGDCQQAAGLLARLHLEFDPAGKVVERDAEPAVHEWQSLQSMIPKSVKRFSDKIMLYLKR